MSNPSKSVAAHLAQEVAAQRLQYDPSQRDAALRLDQLSANLRRHSPTFTHRLRAYLPWPACGAGATAQRGVYLWGGVGRGKTLLMDAFHVSLPAAMAERSHFYGFMRRVHAELRGASRREAPLEIVAERLARRARVICLDEFLVCDIADAMILAGLFDALFRRGVTLVATSNLPPRDLYRDGLQRPRFLPTIELIQAHADVLHLDGGVDYRLRQLEQAPTYLDTALPGTAAALHRRFEALAGGTASGPTTLIVEARALKAKNVGTGLAWFDFTALCEGPRSQNDYIELAHTYHTIFISDIPTFDRHHDDAARRFIMLIDELYDRGVNLVVGAAAAPLSLYRGERLQFEFQRAASRLIEMQTHHYLAAPHRP